MTVSISAGKHSGHYRLTTQLWLPAPRMQVFEFFADAFQLEAITPPWLHFSVQTARPLIMREGARIDYKLRLHGLPIRWQSCISRWEPPYRFVDEQVKGPYRHWHHLHTFEELDDGTLAGDVVDYSFPCAWLLHPLTVRRDLSRIFHYRREAMKRIFAGSDEIQTLDDG